MAIKIQGTTVIGGGSGQNSISLENIAAINANTETAFLNAGFKKTTGGTTLEAVVSGTLSTGEAVVVNSNGTVSVAGERIVPQQSTGELNPVFTSANRGRCAGAFYDEDNQKVLLFFTDIGFGSDLTEDYGYVIVGTISGDTITFGTPTVFNSEITRKVVVTKYNSNRIVVAADTQGASISERRVSAFLMGLNVNGTTMDIYDSAIIGDNSSTPSSVGSIITRSGTVHCSWTRSSPSGVPYISDFTITSDTITNIVITQVTSLGTGYYYTKMIYMSDLDKFVIAGIRSLGSNIRAGVASYATSWSFDSGSTVYTPSGTSINFRQNDFDFIDVGSEYGNYRIIFVFNFTGGEGIYYLTAYINGTTILSSTNPSGQGTASFPYIYGFECLYDATNKIVRVMIEGFGQTGYYSLKPVNNGNPAVIGPKTTGYYGDSAATMVDEKILIFHEEIASDGASTTEQYAQLITPYIPNPNTNISNTNFIGFSDGDYANGVTATINVSGLAETNRNDLIPGERYWLLDNGEISIDLYQAFTDDIYAPQVAGIPVSNTTIMIKEDNF